MHPLAPSGQETRIPHDVSQCSPPTHGEFTRRAAMRVHAGEVTCRPAIRRPGSGSAKLASRLRLDLNQATPPSLSHWSRHNSTIESLFDACPLKCVSDSDIRCLPQFAVDLSVRTKRRQRIEGDSEWDACGNRPDRRWHSHLALNRTQPKSCVDTNETSSVGFGDFAGLRTTATHAPARASRRAVWATAFRRVRPSLRPANRRRVCPDQPGSRAGEWPRPGRSGFVNRERPAPP